MITRRMLSVPLITLAAVAFSSAGCGTVTNLFSDDFLAAIGLGVSVPSLPGDAPALLVTVENRTSRTAEMVVSYRVESDVVENFTTVVQPGERSAQALVCPIEEITLGDVSDLNQSGVRVRLGNGLATDPFVEVEPFGVLLRDTVNYNCGDGVTFTVQSSSATLSGYQTFAFIQRAVAN